MELIKNVSDFYTSVEKALHEIDENWLNYKGLIVVGSHFPSSVEEKLQKIKEAREQNIPFLGICFGMQLMAIEFARNVLNMEKANSEEIDANADLIYKLPELRVGIKPVTWSGGQTYESHWHNYAFNQKYHEVFSNYFDISYTENVAEIIKLRSHPFFTGVQFHPEYQSSKDKPHLLLSQFLEICRNGNVAGAQPSAN